MAQIYETRVGWTINGASGAGVSTFYSTSTGTFQFNLHTFYDSLKGHFPTAVSFIFPSSGRTLEDSTGAVTGAWTGTAQGTVVGTATNAWSLPSGACTIWKTSTPWHRRIAQGRTFLVPLDGASYEANGTLSTVAFANIQSASNSLISSSGPTFILWMRPKLGKDANGEIIVQRAGGSAPIVASQLKDKVAVLTSRRD